MQLDLDSEHAYTQVIDTVNDPVVHERLAHFLEDHRRHVSHLGEQIQSLGGKAPDSSRDFKGYVMEGVMSLAEAAGLADALNVIKVAEEVTHRAYADAISLDLPPDLKEIIRKHFTDEKNHLNYIVRNS